MSPGIRRSAAAVLTAAALVFTWVVVRQSQRAEALRGTARVRGEAGQASPPAPAAPVESNTPAAGAKSAPLTPAEKFELMKLRSQVTDLRERLRARAGISNEHAVLQARLTTATNAASGRVPPGWVRRKDARHRGFSRPQDAFETFIWAVETRNTNVLFEAVAPTMRAHLAQAFQRGDGGSPWTEFGQLPGFVIRSIRAEGEGFNVMEAEILPGLPPVPVKARLLDGAWRIEL